MEYDGTRWDNEFMVKLCWPNGGSLKGETPEGFFDGNCYPNQRFGHFLMARRYLKRSFGRLHMGTVTRAEVFGAVTEMPLVIDRAS